jgi:hypothetical protein
MKNLGAPAPATLQRTKQRSMLDFKELPSDGIKFEQLIRELFIRLELEVHWTGVGPDAGRDLVVTEKAIGKLAPLERKWLVSCKHFALSGRSVGLDDIAGITDACAAVDATGFLLAASTQPSAAVVRRLEELSGAGHLTTRYWDGIEIEKRLNAPETFPLIDQFFPASAKQIPWKIYNTTKPSFWAANYKSYFLYLGSRTSNLFPKLKDVEEIVRRLESIKMPKGEDWAHHYIRPRAVYFDDKHEQYTVFADYLYPREKQKDVLRPAILNRVLKDGQGLYTDGDWMSHLTHWDVRYVETSQVSDHFHLDHKDYYEPYINNFQSGLARHRYFVGDMDEYFPYMLESGSV